VRKAIFDSLLRSMEAHSEEPRRHETRQTSNLDANNISKRCCSATSAGNPGAFFLPFFDSSLIFFEA
jgi:hypothetical protein